jgi:hypothetical protein
VAVEPQDNPVLSAVTVVVYRCAPFLIPSEAVALQDLTVIRRDSVRLSASA